MMPPVTFPKHDHVLARGLVFAGTLLTPSRCFTCNARLDIVLEVESGACVVRPGWTGVIRFTSFALVRPSTMGRA